jgi:hypothetical protein
VSGPLGYVWISPHAVERVAQHHPLTDKRDVSARLDLATEIEQGAAAGLLDRSMEAVQDRYFLAHDRRGIFVVAETDNRNEPGTIWRVLVTYVRFEASQEALAHNLWPTRAAA